eukprot:6946257-Alexandrium_andersonii.AAC.1
MRAGCSSCGSSASAAAAAPAAAPSTVAPAADVCRLQLLLQLSHCCGTCRSFVSTAAPVVA